MTSYDAPASSCMTSPVVTIPAGAALTDAESRLASLAISCLAVVDHTGVLDAATPISPGPL